MKILRPVICLTTALLVSISSWTLATPAGAYTTTGCRWGGASPTISTMNVSGIYTTPFYNARNDINASTPVDLKTTIDGAAWWAWNGNYGTTGWEGLSSWTCNGGKVTGANSKLNNTYLSGAPAGRLKVVWLHELSHVFGLGHVSVGTRVMFTSASAAYNNGVRTLTSDEIAGYDYLY